jgi:hypothetical protein
VQQGGRTRRAMPKNWKVAPRPAHLLIVDDDLLLRGRGPH